MGLLLEIYFNFTLRQYYENWKSYQISGHYLSNVRYADNTVFILYTERKIQEILEKIIKGRYKKGVNINFKKTEYVVLRKKEDRKWFTEIQRHIRIRRKCFPNTNPNMKTPENLLHTSTALLNTSYLIYVLIYLLIILYFIFCHIYSCISIITI